MSDSIFNVRVFAWHFIISKSPLRARITYNNYHSDNDWPDGKFKIYTLGNNHFD
jgi:hypothetical protein